MDAPAKLLSISQERDVINENIIRASKFSTWYSSKRLNFALVIGS